LINIQLFGGPGTGKSTTAAGVFYEMKTQGKKVELLQEFAKELTFSCDDTRLNDQILVFAEQHHRLKRVENQVDYLIHDSPFVMGVVYAKDDIFKKEFNELIVKTYNSYNNINIFLERSDYHEYQKYGRKQTLEEAIKIDNEIKQMLIDNNIPFTTLIIDKNIVKKITKLI